MFSVEYLGSKNDKQTESYEDLTGDIFVLKNETVMYAKTISHQTLLKF